MSSLKNEARVFWGRVVRGLGVTSSIVSYSIERRLRVTGSQIQKWGHPLKGPCQEEKLLLGKKKGFSGKAWHCWLSRGRTKVIDQRNEDRGTWNKETRRHGDMGARKTTRSDQGKQSEKLGSRSKERGDRNERGCELADARWAFWGELSGKGVR